MKKLLTFAMLTIVATALHAAVINWGGDSLNSANTTGLVGDGTQSDDYIGYATAGTVYNLIYFGATAPGAPTKYDTATGLTDKGGTIVDTHTLTSDEADNGALETLPYSGPADDIKGFYMVTMYDVTTGTADFFSFEASGLSDTGSAFDAETLIRDAELGNHMGSVSVVPEPTSVALLAIGLAALGLKRKVA